LNGKYLREGFCSKSLFWAAGDRHRQDDLDSEHEAENRTVFSFIFILKVIRFVAELRQELLLSPTNGFCL